MTPQTADLVREHAKLHSELRASTLNSMTLVFIGLIVGYDLALAVVHLHGRV